MAAVTSERLRLPRLLSRCPDGLTEAAMLAHGYRIEMLAHVVREGLMTATLQNMRAASRPIDVVRLLITEAGRLALG